MMQRGNYIKCCVSSEHLIMMVIYYNWPITANHHWRDPPRARALLHDRNPREDEEGLQSHEGTSDCVDAGLKVFV